MFIIDPYRFGVPPFTPLSISDCFLWLDGDDPATITMAASPKVSGWADKSTNAFSFAQGDTTKQPTLNTTFYTRPCMQFDAALTGSGLSYLATTSGTVTPPAAHTLFAVVKWNPNSNTSYRTVALLSTTSLNAIQGGTGIPLWMIYGATTGTAGAFQVTFAGGVTAYQPSLDQAANTSSVYTYSQNGNVTSSALDRDGVSKTLTTAGTTWTPSLRALVVGSCDTTYLPRGAFAEIIMYSRVLTAGEISDVQAYLAAKWV